MTKTNLALLIGGALAYALVVVGVGVSIRQGFPSASSAPATSMLQLVWDQPPGVPPTSSGTRPKRSQQLAWDQPPGVPPTSSGTRPKGIERGGLMPV